MKEKLNEVWRTVWCIYGIMLVLTLILLIIANRKYKMESPVEQQYKETFSFMDGWVDERGNRANLENLYQKGRRKEKKEYSVYHRIPNQIKEGYTLNITAKNILYHFYVDDVLLEDVYSPKTQEVENSFGRKYSIIPIEKYMGGKTLEMRFELVYAGKSATFLDMSLGLPQGYWLHFAKEKTLSVLTCMLFLFVSVLLIIVDIPINIMNKKNHELLALGLLSLAVGLWGLMSTHVVELFSGDGRTTQIAESLFLSLIVLPLFFYIRYSMGFIHYKELKVYTLLSFTEFLSVWILEITDVADVQKTLICTHIMLALGVLILISLVFRKNNTYQERKGSDFYHVFRCLGLISLLAGTVIDIFRYYLSNVADDTIYVRLGLLLFIICFGVASLEKIIHAVRIGAKAEFISQLAYQDGLTNLSNRTAFKERMDSIQLDQENAAILMFDVNNLKVVNDTLGHQYGDEMLVKSSRIILNAFEEIGGECYRIGGDEFVVILAKEDLYETLTSGLKRFKDNVKQYNAKEQLKYQIRIAYGYATSLEEPCTMKQMYETADRRMYECKKRMKASMPEDNIIHR
ncbi:GGDEF domain-containing protein [[Clostridium] polysaccharolyticum]|uniref:Diguanylate cyclase (GGDEF) domain-containing protein n=1 Tax=[Clostridium] polysaccharolyticum TaxID=29364 RepID=A0A1I0CJA9_9FIRM|nr:GGDEF domain-containing protein [[Clostridium] polysaccharolyticum]SET19252.1 diguanylate cyclase (GGDEF) domain-containing protein [[Clostridium] polysaccharolyticum]